MVREAANANGGKTTGELTAPPTGSEGIGADRMLRVAGTSDPTLQRKLVMEAVGRGGLLRGETMEDAMLAAIAALEAIGPRDGLEGILATQMIATHEAAMDCLRRASIPNQTVVGQELNLKHAEKLMQLYARQIEALDKHRGKGQQKITVEHVTVQPGGQAIVGNVQAPSPPRPEAPAPPPAILDHSDEVGVLPDFLAELAPAKATVRTRRK